MRSRLKRGSLPLTSRMLGLSIVIVVVGSTLISLIMSQAAFRSLDQKSSLKASLMTSMTRGAANNPHQRQPQKSLALLYPPGLMGGYRNQFLRFIAFLDYGIRRDIKQLFLPSLLWSTKIGGEWRPIPMDWVFDVDYWNTFSTLPRIVKQVDGVSDCWMGGTELREQQLLLFNTSSVDEGSLDHALVQGGTFRSLSNVTLPLFLAPPDEGIVLRKTDHLPPVENCTNPFVYGGGTKAGRLWNDFMRISKSSDPQNHSSWWGDVYRALRPAPRWRQVVEEACFRGPHFVALHARVEIEMLMHNCGVDMERNLTRIVQMVQDKFGSTTDILVAVSRKDMYTNHGDFIDLALANLQYLDAAVEQGVVYECGASVLDRYYAAQEQSRIPDHGSLLESVINFYAAVSANIFVGVQGSSYSTDVWTTRYWMGKGDQNYRYTNEGTILQVEGLPRPHSNCKRRRKKSKDKA